MTIGLASAAKEPRTAMVDTGESTVVAAVSRLAQGRAVVLFEPITGVGEIVLSAEHATPELIAFAVRHTSGFLCVTVPASECARLDLPPQAGAALPSEDQLDFRVTVDSRAHITTGISAADRSRTVRMLADPAACAADFSRPGHVVPVCVADRGSLERPGRAEAAADLCRMAGLGPNAVFAVVVHDSFIPGAAVGAWVREFANEHDLPLVTMEEVRAAVPDLGVNEGAVAVDDRYLLAVRDDQTATDEVSLMVTDLITGTRHTISLDLSQVAGAVFDQRLGEGGP